MNPSRRGGAVPATRRGLDRSEGEPEMSNGSEQGGGGKNPNTMGGIFDDPPDQGGGPSKNPLILGGERPVARSEGPKNPHTLGGDDKAGDDRPAEGGEDEAAAAAGDEQPEQGGGTTKAPDARGVDTAQRTDGPKNPGTLGGERGAGATDPRAAGDDPPDQGGGNKAGGTLEGDNRDPRRDGSLHPPTLGGER